MKKLLIALLCLPTLAFAGPTMRAEDGKGNYTRLFTIPCANNVVLAMTPAEYRAHLRAGEAGIDGKVYGMCWLLLQDGWVIMLYDDGDQGRLSVTEFRPEPDA